MDIVPGFAVSFAREGRIDLVKRNPAEFADFAVLFGYGLIGVAEGGGEDDNFFVDLAIFDDVREAVADGFVNINV